MFIYYNFLIVFDIQYTYIFVLEGRCMERLDKDATGSCASLSRMIDMVGFGRYWPFVRQDRVSCCGRRHLARSQIADSIEKKTALRLSEGPSMYA